MRVNQVTNAKGIEMTATIEITGTENYGQVGTLRMRLPGWCLDMAREYAAANGLATIDIADFFETPEYKAQVERNMDGWDRVTNADINANR